MYRKPRVTSQIVAQQVAQSVFTPPPPKKEKKEKKNEHKKEKLEKVELAAGGKIHLFHFLIDTYRNEFLSSF